MMTLLSPRVTHDARDDGFTVVELLVSMFVLTIVMAIATTGLITAMQHQRRSVAQVDALNRSTIALARMTTSVRGADPIVVAETDGIEVTLPDGGGTVQRTYRVVTDGSGEQRIIACNGAYAACVAGAGSVLTTNVVNDATDPLFSYFDADGNALSAPVAAVDLEGIREVAINPLVDYPEGTDPIDINNDVQVRNWSE